MSQSCNLFKLQKTKKKIFNRYNNRDSRGSRAQIQERNGSDGSGNQIDRPDPQSTYNEQHDAMTAYISPAMVCFFVVAMCTMLLMLYFFFGYLGTRTYFVLPGRK